MTASRTVFLTILTYCIYAFSIFLQTKKIVFPIPLNDFVLLGVSAFILFLSNESLKKNSLYVLALFFYFLQHQSNFSLFIDEDLVITMEEYAIFSFAFYFFIICIVVYFFMIFNLLFSIIISFVFIVLSFVLTDYFYLFCSFVAFTPLLYKWIYNIEENSQLALVQHLFILFSFISFTYSFSFEL